MGGRSRERLSATCSSSLYYSEKRQTEDENEGEPTPRATNWIKCRMRRKNDLYSNSPPSYLDFRCS
jgi:hypothetical protein